MQAHKVSCMAYVVRGDRLSWSNLNDILEKASNREKGFPNNSRFILSRCFGGTKKGHQEQGKKNDSSNQWQSNKQTKAKEFCLTPPLINLTYLHNDVIHPVGDRPSHFISAWEMGAKDYLLKFII